MMKRKYPTIYPVLNLKEGKVIDIFDDVETARNYIRKQMKEDKTIGVNTLSVLLPETRGNLVEFTLGQLLDIYELVLPTGAKKHSFRKKHTAIASIMRYLGQKKVTLSHKSSSIKTPPRKRDTTPVRKTIIGARPKVEPKIEKIKAKSKVFPSPREPKKPRFRMRFKLPQEVTTTIVELSTTGESYRLTEETGYSQRYLYHKYITKGYDKETVLRKVKHQTGEKQNPNYYQIYFNEVKKLGALRDEKPNKYH